MISSYSRTAGACGHQIDAESGRRICYWIPRRAGNGPRHEQSAQWWTRTFANTDLAPEIVAALEAYSQRVAESRRAPRRRSRDVLRAMVAVDAVVFRHAARSRSTGRTRP
jgi:hypothetical protein